MLVGAFIWQMHSLFESQLIQCEIICKVGNAFDYLLQSECDEAIRDGTRYNGLVVVQVNYKCMFDYIQSYYEDAERITTWKDKASRSWGIQCFLYVIGSSIIIAAKWPKTQF